MMKNLFSILIKIGLLAGVGYAAVATNPKPARHQAAIEAKEAALKEEDVLGMADRMMRPSRSEAQEEKPMTYHNYFVASKVTDSEGAMMSFGLFQKVFVTQNEL
jgi:hypothetical protein